MLHGYARFSSTREDLERQLRVLTEHGIPRERMHVDDAVGPVQDRPGFTALLAAASPGHIIVVTTLDRLACNLSDCLRVVHDLREHRIGLRTLEDPLAIDTATPAAAVAVELLDLFNHMNTVYARERAARAREIARATGAQRGRPASFTPDQLADALRTGNEGRPVAEAASALGVHRSTVHRHLAAARATTTDEHPPNETRTPKPRRER